jgi:hypothetical protein
MSRHIAACRSLFLFFWRKLFLDTFRTRYQVLNGWDNLNKRCADEGWNNGVNRLRAYRHHHHQSNKNDGWRGIGDICYFHASILATMTIKLMKFFLPRLKQFNFFFHSISPSTTQGDLNISAMPCIEFKFNNNNNNILTSNLSFGTKFSSIVESEASSTLNSLVSTNAPLQTTLVSVCVIFNSFSPFK